MKFQLLQLLIIASLFAYSCATNCTPDDWLKYQEKYKKTYKSTEDEMIHYKQFCESIKLIDQHNELYKKGETTYTMGVNQFADMTPFEVQQYFHGNSRTQEKASGFRSSLIF